jgi:hypothetical protein
MDWSVGSGIGAGVSQGIQNAQGLQSIQHGQQQMALEQRKMALLENEATQQSALTDLQIKEARAQHMEAEKDRKPVYIGTFIPNYDSMEPAEKKGLEQAVLGAGGEMVNGQLTVNRAAFRRFTQDATIQHQFGVTFANGIISSNQMAIKNLTSEFDKLEEKVKKKAEKLGEKEFRNVIDSDEDYQKRNQILQEINQRKQKIVDVTTERDFHKDSLIQQYMTTEENIGKQLDMQNKVILAGQTEAIKQAVKQPYVEQAQEHQEKMEDKRQAGRLKMNELTNLLRIRMHNDSEAGKNNRFQEALTNQGQARLDSQLTKENIAIEKEYHGQPAIQGLITQKVYDMAKEKPFTRPEEIATAVSKAKTEAAPYQKALTFGTTFKNQEAQKDPQRWPQRLMRLLIQKGHSDAEIEWTLGALGAYKND